MPLDLALIWREISSSGRKIYAKTDPVYQIRRISPFPKIRRKNPAAHKNLEHGTVFDKMIKLIVTRIITRFFFS